ncbi:MAG: arginase [Bdellovibrionales bacterium]|nr:arginase [Bdellovibrionales bacterium]
MSNKKPFAILGTGICHGQPKPGVEKGYHYLELMGLWEKMAKVHPRLKNFGNLQFSPNEPAKAYNDLFHKTLEIHNSGFRPALIGGDHSQAFSTISALLNIYPDLKILWVDAHGDMNTPKTSPSGNLHGMPLSGLLGLVPKEDWGMPWLNQLLRADQVIQLGVRDIDHGEQELMDEYGIEYYSPSQVREKGLNHILDDIVKRWAGAPCHLSFDIDGLDSSLVPATGTPVGQGLNMDEGLQIIDTVKGHFNFVSFEVVEFNPDLAKNQQELETTEANVCRLIEAMLAD